MAFTAFGRGQPEVGIHLSVVSDSKYRKMLRSQRKSDTEINFLANFRPSKYLLGS